MNIILFNPPVWPYLDGLHLGLNPNIGLLYLASVLLESEEHSVRVLDAEALRWSVKTCVSIVRAEKPDVVGITATTVGYRSMVELCRKIREAVPGVRLMVGGPHVTVYQEKALKETGADVVVAGEGELVVEDALTHDGIIATGRSTPLDKLAWPAWHVMHPGIGSGQFRGNAPLYDLPETAIQWERGCPHGCKFCSHPVHGNQPTRFRRPEDIVEELKYIQKAHGIRTAFVYDDEMIGLSSKQVEWLHEVLDLILSKGVKINLKTQGRCSQRFVDRELLEKMKRAGFRAIMLGCESGSPKVLQANRKGTTVGDIEHTIRLCSEVGIDTWTFWMVGNLEETDSDAQMTENLLRQLKPCIKFKQVTICTPWAGSEVHERAYREEWVFENDPCKFLANRPVMNTPWMSAQEQVIWQRRLAAV